MYTVIRFLATQERLQALTQVGQAMNAVREGIYTGLRKAGDGFCCDIWEGPEWHEHQREILRFLTEFGESIHAAIRGGATVTVDVAVEPEDRESDGAVLVLRSERDLLASLVSCGAELEVSIY